MKNSTKKILTTATCIASLFSLTACGNLGDRLNRIGQAPQMAQIENPYEQPDYKPVSLPMPTQEALNAQPNSLWQASRQTFFKDQRAHKVGDILTVMIEINDTADMQNKTERSREGSEESGMPSMLGAETKLAKILPEAVDPTKLISTNSTTSSTGDGKIQRNETINLKMAAMVMQVLPNGNFVIQGRQQVRVNFELRDLSLQGVVRPEDILNNNSISHEKIAEARIVYGGKGQVTDLQQPRYGQQILETLSPF